MSVAKGKRLDDYTYIYTCANCGGAGFFANNDECTHCYNLNYDKCMTAFKLARGERYYALLKAILSIAGKDMAGEIAAKDKVFLADLIHLMVAYRFPRNRFKPMVEWLEECMVVRAGTYDRFKESKWTVKSALEAVGYGDYDSA